MARFRNVFGAATAIVMVMAAPVAHAQDSRRFDIDLPAQPLGASLQALALRSGQTVLADASLVRDRPAPAIRGNYTAEQALSLLLAGTGLGFMHVGDSLVVRAAGGSDSPPAARDDKAIVVTGSRIRGAPIVSPAIRIDSQEMRDEGKTNLGDVVRSIPQAFGGGQNPGVGNNVPSASGVNVGSASTINLRGLGSDATLTLLDGHRLAYNGTRQGIDVSALPFGIVDHLEIVADGASALYGSDAVAGVANIILKRDYNGFETRADIGGSTDGGDFQQQYGALAGRRWSTGGFALAYEYARNTDILSDQRAYADSRPGVVLYPALSRNAVALTGHQALGSNLTFQIDALFNRRSSFSEFPLNTAGNDLVSHQEQLSTSRSLGFAPSLNLDLGRWRLSLAGTYGSENVHLASNAYAGTTPTSATAGCYCNTGGSVELAGDGSLFRLPGGDAKLAAGAGWRSNTLDANLGQGNVNNIDRSQDSTYGFGELSLPLVSPDQDIAWIRRLNLSAAVRYERYPGIASVATPKFGGIYAPTPDIDLKASWGRSFRAPTLYQEYQARSALLYPAASLGSSGPANATALFLQGGKRTLKPERAKTWTATIEFHPRAVPDLRLQLGYFSTIYTNRIVTPISYLATALSSPLNAGRVTVAPGATAVADAIAGAAQFYNVSGQAYNPANVAAIVDDTSVNAGRQAIHGLDMLASYKVAVGHAGGQLAGNVDASYLVSTQQLTPGAPVTQLAGTLFNPPHWRGRGSVTWKEGPLTLNATGSVIGGVEDVRSTPAVSVSGMTTLDLTARYEFAARQGLLHGLRLNLTVQDLFDDHPTTIRTTSFYDMAYDSTNYAPVGRFIGFGIDKSW